MNPQSAIRNPQSAILPRNRQSATGTLWVNPQFFLFFFDYQNSAKIFFMAISKLTPLGKEIQRQLDRMGWSQRMLAINANITHGAISKIMRGKTKPQLETIVAIGDALNVDPTYLMQLAGVALPALSPTNKEVDPAVLHVVQRLTELPITPRSHAINAIEGVLDAVYAARFDTHYWPTSSKENNESDSEAVSESTKKSSVAPSSEREPLSQEEAARAYAYIQEFQRLFPEQYAEIAERLGEPTPLQD
ncbi:MAG: helix-turn-helix domain-containing protein [Ardenticatenaceae bacterium]